MVKLQSIKGLLVNWDEETIGQKSLNLNREKLAMLIYEDMREGFFKFLHPVNEYPEWDKADERWRTTAYRQADKIKSDLPNLLEVVE